ncbi:hypothetical protein IE53DRAFT_48125 [Violaceomyces palustris]|uniref:Uncharacterized protein n=1 Tax=Violaceomyces palustris TaxID=1673888 RepID=A0ACD0P094_9BASI|nr:hypothetical protein IE53DRAFT_48125 [Violaceomyces palustris]
MQAEHLEKHYDNGQESRCRRDAEGGQREGGDGSIRKLTHTVKEKSKKDQFKRNREHGKGKRFEGGGLCFSFAMPIPLGFPSLSLSLSLFLALGWTRGCSSRPHSLSRSRLPTASSTRTCLPSPSTNRCQVRQKEEPWFKQGKELPLREREGERERGRERVCVCVCQCVCVNDGEQRRLGSMKEKEKRTRMKNLAQAQPGGGERKESKFEPNE